jgi:amidase
VAAGLSALEFGSDIGGSIRIPAAFCGLFGHKPSAGLVPRGGHFPAQGNLPNPGQPLGVQGPLARSAADLRLGLNVIAGPEGLDSKAWRIERPAARQQALKDYRVALLELPEWLAVDQEIVAALEDVARNLEKEGCKVQRVSPEGFADFSTYYQHYLKILQCVIGADLPEEVRQRAANKLQGRDDQFLDAIADGLLSGAGQLLMLLERTEAYKQRWEAFFKDVDILLAPVNMVCAFEHDDAFLYDRVLTINGEQAAYYQQSFLSSLATMGGLPATAVPVGLNSKGLPIGVQLISAFMEDETCIDFAARLEAMGYAFSPPPGFE